MTYRTTNDSRRFLFSRAGTYMRAINRSLPEPALRQAGEEGEPTLPDHLMRLPGGDWRVWKCVCLRGAGFPAQEVLKLASRACVVAADELAAAEDEVEPAKRSLVESLNRRRSSAGPDTLPALERALKQVRKGKPPKMADLEEEARPDAERFYRAVQNREGAKAQYRSVFADAVLDLSKRIYEIAGSDRFREAVLWQNRHAYRTSIEVLLSKSNMAARSSKHRQHEAMVANYLQRYCVKNDTIGFFGPVGWASFVEGPEVMTVKPGNELLASRNIYFEGWCIDALAESLSRIKSFRPWIEPRRMPFIRQSGTFVHIPYEKPLRLDDRLARLLRECDGRRRARAIAADLIADPGSGFSKAEEVYGGLRSLEYKLLINWSFDIPMGPRPDAVFRGMLEELEDRELRRASLLLLDHLETARRAIADATGDVSQLDRALTSLENTFSRLTGKSSTRSEGKTYAARTLVYEDCQRSGEVTFGSAFLKELGPPLSLLLASARWFTFQAASFYRQQFKRTYAEIAQQTGSSSVQRHYFLDQKQRASIFGRKTLAGRPDGGVPVQMARGSGNEA